MRQNKLDTKSISIRIPYKTLKALQYIANYEGRSMNSQVLYLIRECINDFKEKNGEINLEQHYSLSISPCSNSKSLTQ